MNDVGRYDTILLNFFNKQHLCFSFSFDKWSKRSIKCPLITIVPRKLFTFPSSNEWKRDTVFKLLCFQTQNFRLISKRVVNFAISICSVQREKYIYIYTYVYSFVFYPINRSPFQLSSIRPTRIYVSYGTTEALTTNCNFAFRYLAACQRKIEPKSVAAV